MCTVLLYKLRAAPSPRFPGTRSIWNTALNGYLGEIYSWLLLDIEVQLFGMWIRGRDLTKKIRNDELMQLLTIYVQETGHNWRWCLR